MVGKITAFSCGNAFLFGEYAALVGGSAIIAGLGGPLTVTATLSHKDSFYSPEFGNPVMIKQTLAFFRAKYGFMEPVSLKAESKLPAGKGFGSSDACIVSTYAALLGLFGIKLTKEKVLKEMFEFKSENKVCSIGALAATVYGGLVKTRGNKVVSHVQLKNPLDYLFVYSGKHGHGVIKQFLKNYKNDTSYKQAVKLMNGITTQAWKKRNDFPEVGVLMSQYQGLLEFVGASDKTMASLVHTARESGALGAKISGGGRGDCIVSVQSKKLSAFERKHGCFRFDYSQGLKIIKG